MAALPHDHAERLARARAALDGLSVGDAFGQRFFHREVGVLLIRRRVPPGPWRWTDDTAMALSIVDVLEAHGAIDQDALAAAFARRYAEAPGRGYGAGAHDYLSQMARGAPWRTTTRQAFGGAGSLGNGAAMRVAPLAGYFADDLDRVVDEARRSAEVTHAHAEGQAGAVAAAVATALAWQQRPCGDEPGRFISAVAERTPASATRDGLVRAALLPPSTSPSGAARALGNGSHVRADDTVPLCVWAIARFAGSYEEALWQTVSALGDRDTTCAIVGGAVALAAGVEAIPAAWREAREPLPGP